MSIKNDMHILLTRPLEDCSEMIMKFKSLGHQVSHLPLLTVDKVNHDKIIFTNYKGIIFTSANAIKFLDIKTIDKKLICYGGTAINDILPKEQQFYNLTIETCLVW